MHHIILIFSLLSLSFSSLGFTDSKIANNDGSCSAPSDCQSGCCVESCDGRSCYNSYCTQSIGLNEQPKGGPCGAPDQVVAKSAMHACDQSMKLLLGSTMSLGTLRGKMSC